MWLPQRAFLLPAVNEGGLTWYRPQQGLNESAVSAVKRPVAGGFAFGGADSMPVEACSLALWGAKQVNATRREK